MNSVDEILKLNFNQSGWIINKPERGKSKESYIAQNGRIKVFVKFDVSTQALDILSQIGAAPKVIASGNYNGRPYIIQKFIEGTHPDSTWFKDHLKEIAHFIKKYHEDKQLRAILDTKKYDYEQYIQRDLKYVSEELTSSPLVSSKRVNDVFRKIKERATNLKQATLVPVHADPNSANFLISDEDFYMIDWDDIYLSDPLRDTAMILYRFYHNDQWSKFLDYCGESLDEDKLYYWIARDCLGIALWFSKRGDDNSTEIHLNATEAALQKQENPFFGKL